MAHVELPGVAAQLHLLAAQPADLDIAVGQQQARRAGFHQARLVAAGLDRRLAGHQLDLRPAVAGGDAQAGLRVQRQRQLLRVQRIAALPPVAVR